MEPFLALLLAVVLGVPLGLALWIAVLQGRLRDVLDEVRRLSRELHDLRRSLLEARYTPRAGDGTEARAEVQPTCEPRGAAPGEHLGEGEPDPASPPPTHVQGSGATPSGAGPSPSAVLGLDVPPRPGRTTALAAPADPNTSPTGATLGSASATLVRPADTTDADDGFDWERWLGVRGAAVVGGIALALAGLFFVQLAIQRGWIGPAMRDGLAVGFGALGLGAFVPLHRRGYVAQAGAIGGAGSILVYLGAWAAARLHGLVPMAPAFVVMAVTTVVAGRLALRAGSRSLAAFAVLGGFATPVLLDVGARSTSALFAYLGLLNLGALLAGERTGWRWLPRVTVVATALVELRWYVPAFVGGYTSAPPRVGALAAVASIAFVHLLATHLNARRAGAASPRAPSMLHAALLLQVLLAMHLGRDLSSEASLVPVAGMAVLFAVAAAWLGRGFGDPTLTFLGGVGGFAVLASWTQMHPARFAADPALFTRLVMEYGLGASVLALALFGVERGLARRGRAAPTTAATSVGSLVVLGTLVASNAGSAPIWLVAAAACALGAIGLAALERPAAGVLAPLIGVLVALALGPTIRPERSLALLHGAPLADLGAAALLGSVALGVALARWSSRAAVAAAAAATIGLLRVAGAGVGTSASGDQPLVFVSLAGLGSLAFVTRRALARDWPARLTHAALALATMVVLVTWCGQVAWRTDDVPWEAIVALVAAASAVALAVVLRRPTRREPTASGEVATDTSGADRGPASHHAAMRADSPEACLHRLFASEHAPGAALAWVAGSPAFVVFLPAVRTLSERLGGEHGRELGFLVALLPAALAGGVAWLRRERAVAAPLLTWAAILAAFALAHTVGVHPGIVGVALGASASVAVGRAAGRRDPRVLGAALAGLAAIVFLSMGLDGRVFVHEGLLAPRLAWVALAVVAGLVVASAAGARTPLRLLLLAVTFLWLNLLIVNHYSEGATIALRFAREPQRDLVLSLGWAVYAGVLLALGQLGRSRALRWASLAFFLVTVFKVFLFDLGSLRGGYRAASFLGLAVALFSVSLVYQRWVLPPRRRRE